MNLGGIKREGQNGPRVLVRTEETSKRFWWRIGNLGMIRGWGTGRVLARLGTETLLEAWGQSGYNSQGLAEIRVASNGLPEGMLWHGEILGAMPGGLRFQATKKQLALNAGMMLQRLQVTGAPESLEVYWGGRPVFLSNQRGQRRDWQTVFQVERGGLIVNIGDAPKEISVWSAPGTKIVLDRRGEQTNKAVWLRLEN